MGQSAIYLANDLAGVGEAFLTHSGWLNVAKST